MKAGIGYRREGAPQGRKPVEIKEQAGAGGALVARLRVLRMLHGTVQLCGVRRWVLRLPYIRREGPHSYHSIVPCVRHCRARALTVLPRRVAVVGKACCCHRCSPAPGCGRYAKHARAEEALGTLLCWAAAAWAAGGGTDAMKDIVRT